MPILPWMKDKDDETKLEIHLPDADQKKIDAAAAAASELPKIKEMLEGLTKIQADRTAAEKAAADKAAADAARKTQIESQGTLEEQVEALMLEGRTKDAIALATQGQSQAIMAIRADQVRNELFSGNSDKYKYYHGDIKKEVDSLLEKQSLSFRTDPANVENCYLTVIGKHHDEILEGKIKSRFAGSDSGSRGTSTGSAGDTGSGDRGNRVIPDEVKQAARHFGMKPEDYADLLDKEGIGYA